MRQQNTTSSSGIGFTGLLTIVFITLKLTHFIDWSWWWVLSPLWISFSLFMGVLLIAGIWAILIVWLNSVSKNKRIK